MMETMTTAIYDAQPRMTHRYAAAAAVVSMATVSMVIAVRREPVSD